jgi:N-[(2S)-2-amino-2-carboxyethyl]-L-glutamate dehydrogenase
MAGRVSVPADRPVVFSPFARAGQLHVIDDFFHELRRYG